MTARSRLGSSVSAGTRYGTPASRILRFARTKRWAIVESGTRNARAISGRLQPAEQPQRQGDLRLGGQRRMTAGEDQPQPVVLHGSLLRLVVTQVQQGGLGVPVGTGSFSAQPIDGPTASGRHDPAAGVGRQTGARPLLHRYHEGVLDRLLRETRCRRGGAPAWPPPGSAPAGTPRRWPRRRRTAGTPQSSGISWNGRTSTGPPHAAAALADHVNALSRSVALMTQKPPSCSLVSANGPSVMITSPSRSRTTVAVFTGCSPPANTHAPAARSCALKASTSR